MQKNIKITQKVQLSKSLEDRKNYLSDQKIILSNKLDISKKAYNKFTIDNGLGNIDGFISLGDINTSSKKVALDDFDNNLKQNQSKNIAGSTAQLKKTNNAKAGQRFEKQFALLEEYESDFLNLSSKLKPNSKHLKI